MKTEALAAIIVAFGTFIGAVVLAYRGLSGDRFQRKVSESAALLSGYTEMVKNLRTELDEVRKSHESDMGRMLKNHTIELTTQADLWDKERGRWDRDRERMDERIELLEAQVAALLNQLNNHGGTT